MKPEEWTKQIELETATAGGDIMKAMQRIERRNEDALIRDAIQRSNDGETDWDALVHGLGRNGRPWLLLLVWDKLPNDQRINGICDTWTAAEFSERLLKRDEWLEMFDAVGYVDEAGLLARCGNLGTKLRHKAGWLGIWLVFSSNSSR